MRRVGANFSLRHRAEERNNCNVHEASVVRAEQITPPFMRNSAGDIEQGK